MLFQVHFLALLLEERGAGSLAEVAEGMSQKLIRRHPHVFGEAEAETAGEVLRNWDRIKREEEGRGAGEPFADVPENLPALLYARKIQRRAPSAGLEGAEPERADRRPGAPRGAPSAGSARPCSRWSTSRAACASTPSSPCAPSAQRFRERRRGD